jgi:hypothetical protein
MPEYRIYVLALEGHFQSSIALPNCLDDAAAIKAAVQFIDGHDIELWQLDRKVGSIDYKTKSLKTV